VDHLHGQQSEWVLDQVDWLRTSADERALAAAQSRRYDEMLQVLGHSALTLRFLRTTVEQRKRAGPPCICVSSLRSRCRAVVPGVLAGVHVYMLWVGCGTAPDRCLVRQCRQVYVL